MPNLFSRLDHEIMRVAAEAPDADLFSLEILGPFDLRLTENTVGQNVFYTANKNQIGETLDVGPHIADRAGAPESPRRRSMSRRLPPATTG